jgi:hypothetical protein
MADNPEWMPVFVLVVAHGNTVQAAHPDHKEPLPTVQAEAGAHRIGTAWRAEDGSYLIDLIALPVNGRLLIRQPRDGENPHFTCGEAR